MYVSPRFSSHKWYLLAFTTMILLVFILASGNQPVVADDETYVVQIAPQAWQQLEDVTAVTQHDYTTFIWLELTAANFAKLQASGSTYQLLTQPFTLILGEQRFDPLRQTPTFSGGWGTAVTHNNTDLHLIQFNGPTKTEWLDALTNQGLEIVQYIHPYTYVVWGSSAQLQNLPTLAAVRWQAPFLAAYRVLPQWRQLPAQSIQVDVLMYRGADTDAVVTQLEALGSSNLGRAILNQTWEITGLFLPGDQLLTAAQIPGVYSIQPTPTDGGLRGEMSNQINVNNHNGSNLAFPGYQSWLNAAGVDGSGVIIANVDGGVLETHADLVNRFIPCTGVTCGNSASSAHGTHTAGIMAADGDSGITDAFGFLRGQGVAPGANMVEQIYSPFFTQPGGMLLLMTDSYNNGASLSGNSWGPSGSPQGYDDDTLQVDIGVRDADPNVAGNQPLSYVLSFMNGGGGTSTQGTPDEAKNIFNIGSTKMQNSNGSQILDINDLSSNTAHGPALDGRTIPHLVAPGCQVDSSVPGGYGMACGTSMASPHVSGAVALFIEYYRDLFGVDPSPALVKAAFLPLAHDLAGNLDADGGTLGHPFDSKQGWGRMDLAAVVSPTHEILYFDNPVIFDNSGEEWIQTLAPADPTQPIRLMLVWTDAPGHGLGGSTPAWNNDLNLVVEANSSTYYGNNFDGSGWSQSGGSPDGMNNTEGIFLGPTPPGSLTIRVVANNINSDGVPHHGDDTDQDFSLVCVNCSLGADFSLTVAPSTLAVCLPDEAVYDVNVLASGGYTQVVNLSALDTPGGTTANFSVNGQPAPYTSTLTIGSTGAAAPGSYNIAVVGMGPTSTHTSTVGLNLFDTVPPSTTLLTPANASDNIPTTPQFMWSDEGAASYLLEVATDPHFSNIIIMETVANTSYTPSTPLSIGTLYFWRVTPSNSCGDGAMSTVFWFITTAPTDICSTPGLAISSGPHTDDLVMASGGSLTDLNVSLDISHTWVGDLIVTLQHVETGTTVTLVDQPGLPVINPGDGCNDNDLVDFILDDESANGPHDNACPNTNATPAYPAGSDWDPIQPLSAFDGESLAGTWRLAVSDAFPAADNGVLHQWCLLPTPGLSSSDLGLIKSATVSETVAGADITYTLVYSNAGPDVAAGVVITEWLPVGLMDVTWSSSGAVVTQTGDLSWAVADLAAGAGGVITVTGTVSPDLSAPAVLYNVAMISGSGTEANMANNVGKHVVMVQGYGVDLEASSALSGTAASVVTYTLWLTNTGDIADTYTLDASEGWTAVLSQTSVSLNAGEGTTVTVAVAIPAAASDGEMNVTTVTAVSDTSPAATDSVQLTTTAVVEGYFLHLPFIARSE